jgi:AcrR family transcriptional regulator
MDREQVLESAEAIVDRDGWSELTMSALARELGLAVPSLYRHVRNLEALRGELQCRTLRALGITLERKAMGRSGETAMRALATTFRRFAREHPHRYELAMREPVDREAFEQASLEASRALTAVIRSYGIEDASFEPHLSAFAALHGVVSLESVGFFPSPTIADADHRGRRLRPGARQHPRAARRRRSGKGPGRLNHHRADRMAATHTESSRRT